MDRTITAKAGAVVFALLLYYAIQLPSVWVALQNPWGAPPSWHESGQWLYMTIHHVVQAILAVLVIAVLSGLRFSKWGLNLRHWRQSLRLVGKFSLWFGAIIAASTVLQMATGAQSIYNRPLTADHIIGGMLFMWLVSGISEEILFRALFQTWFARFWTQVITIAGIALPAAGIVAAIFFALVHINFSLSPPAITHFAPMQVLIAFALGIFYAISYHRTGSILAPVLAHNVANGMMETSNLIVAAS